MFNNKLKKEKNLNQKNKECKKDQIKIILNVLVWKNLKFGNKK